MIKDQIALIPSKTEQEEIVNFVEVKVSKMDALIKKSSNAIELMKERKTALISAAVTGKVDVRDYEVVTNG